MLVVLSWVQSRKDAHLKNLWNQIDPPVPAKAVKPPSVDTLKDDEKQCVPKAVF